MDKVCRDCGETKPVTEFFKSPRNAGGYAPRCKPCYMKQQAEYRKRPPREAAPEGMKRCWSCKTDKLPEAFSKNADFHDGLNRTCRECNNARSSAYHRKNRQRLNGKQRERYAKDPARFAEYELKRRYGMTKGEYDQTLAAQGGKCAICASTSPNGVRISRFHVDHCHETGRVRGLLCENCNKGIGLFHDDAALLRVAIEYLDSYSK